MRHNENENVLRFIGLVIALPTFLVFWHTKLQSHWSRRLSFSKALWSDQLPRTFQAQHPNTMPKVVADGQVRGSVPGRVARIKAMTPGRSIDDIRAVLGDKVCASGVELYRNRGWEVTRIGMCCIGSRCDYKAVRSKIS
jgi:hypothetical protein